MPLDPMIARGTPGVDITNTLAQIVQLRQRDQALKVAEDRTRLEESRLNSEAQGAQEQKQLEHLLAKTEWALKSGNPRQAILSDPGIDPRAAQAFSQMNDDQATQILQQKRAEYASKLGIGPPESQDDGMKLGTFNPGDYTPQSLAAFQQSRNPADLVRYQPLQQYAPQRPPEAPADQRLFDWYSKLSPEQRKQYDAMKTSGREDGGEFAAANTNSIRGLVTTAFGGMFDPISGNLTGLKRGDLPNLNRVTARASQIYQGSGGKKPHAVAVQEALQEFHNNRRVEFKSLADAEAALAEERLQPGNTVIINGKPAFRVENFQNVLPPAPAK